MSEKEPPGREAACYPLQLVQGGALCDVPAPLVRISTCGHFAVKVLQKVQQVDQDAISCVYGLPPMPRNGATTALNLLKLLVSQPGRFATKDWLTEKLRPHKSEEEEWGGLARLDNIVSLLRGLLCPLEVPHKKQVGRLLLEYVPPTPESGSGYRLAAYPMIWLDVEALSSHVKQACQLEAEGQDAWAEWQAAYQIGNQGPFLSEGWYSDWSVGRREEVEGYLWQSVQALWRQAVRQQGEAGEEEALRLLREYWLRHPAHEDALRPLIELLGKRGDYQRAEAYYAKLCGLLNEEGKEPDRRTLKTMHFLRSSQQHLLPLGREEEVEGPFSPVIPAIPQEREPSTSLVSSILQVTSNTPSFNQQGIGDSLVQFYERNGEDVSQREQRDWALWFGLQVAQILSIIRLWNKQTEDFTGEIQTLVDHEIKAMDETLEQFRVQNEQSMSRRQALVAIAALPIMFASGLVTDIAIEDFLSQAAASIIACWHLLRGNGLTPVSEIIPKFAPALRTLALRPSQYQQSSARLAAQTAILQAILAMHKLNVAAREAHCNNAIKYSDIAKDPRLQAVTRMYLGYTLSFCYWPRKPEKALPIFQQALRALGREESLIRSDILMGMAEAYAQCKEEQQALHYIGLAKEHFPSYPEHDQSFIYAECGLATLYQWEGKMFLELAEQYPDRDYQIKARDALMQSIGTSSLSDRCTTETIIYQADSARITGELPIYTSALRTAAQRALDIGSKRRYSEALIVFQRTPRRWVNEPQVQALAREIFKQLPGGNR